MSQIGSFPQIRDEDKNLWNHHLVGRYSAKTRDASCIIIDHSLRRPGQRLFPDHSRGGISGWDFEVGESVLRSFRFWISEISSKLFKSSPNFPQLCQETYFLGWKKGQVEKQHSERCSLNKLEHATFWVRRVYKIRSKWICQCYAWIFAWNNIVSYSAIHEINISTWFFLINLESPKVYKTIG